MNHRGAECDAALAAVADGSSLRGGLGLAAALPSAVLIGLCTLVPSRASAQAHGASSAVDRLDCDEQCLETVAQRYMDGLVHHDPARVPFAPDVRFSENDVTLAIGQGLWGSISSASRAPLLATDEVTGNVAWFGTVEEHGAPAYYAMRLKVVGGQISEVETVVERKGRWPAPFGDPAKLAHDGAFAEVLPPQERRERERLRDVANGYFSTVERNDGQLLTSFDPDCQRIENGISTTQGNFGSAALAQGCEAQFRLGFFRINKRVRERRYPLIDAKRGVVVATGFFDHDNSFVRYRTTDGKEHQTLLKWPNSLSLMEAFKIRSGRIYRVEAVFTYVPYFMHSPWVQRGAVAAADAGPAVRAGLQAPAGPCDRACLGDLARRYMGALARHDPAGLPWAARVAYRENGVAMQVGEGEWNTVTAVSSAAIVAADPAAGNVAWLGTVEEHGDPALCAVTLGVREGRIESVETLVDPARGGGPFGEPVMPLRGRPFEDALSPSERIPRTRMVTLIRKYSAGHTPRDDRLRAGRFPIVDVERGVVIFAGELDHPARAAPSAADQAGAAARDARIPYPLTQGFLAAFKIRAGRIERAAAVSTFLPYGMATSAATVEGDAAHPADDVPGELSPEGSK